MPTPAFHFQSVMTYLLDFIVNSATFTNEIPLPKDPVFVIFQTDGFAESVATKPSPPSSIINFNHPVRIVLTLDSLAQAQMYVTLCILQENGNNKQSSVPIGYARIKLKSFPIGCPATFSFSLLNPLNTAITIGSLSLTANISTMVPSIDISSFAMGIPMGRK